MEWGATDAIGKAAVETKICSGKFRQIGFWRKAFCTYFHHMFAKITLKISQKHGALNKKFSPHL